MRIVIDASIAVSWFAPEPTTEVNRKLMRWAEGLLAPELILVETTNALIRKVRNGEFREADIREVWDQLAKLPIVYFAQQDLLPSATRIALQSGHSLYDCLYLALAYEQEAMLATDDRALVRLVQSLDPSVPIWRPASA